MRATILLIAFVCICSLFLAPKLSEAQNNAYKLVYIYTTPGTSGLSAIEFRDLLSQDITQTFYSATHHQAYLSPDSQYVAYVDQEEHTVVIDGNGDTVFRTDFNRDDGNGIWYLWGWRGSQELVAVLLDEHSSRFYQINISDPAHIWTPIAFLEPFFNWSILSLETANRRRYIALEFFEFSPDFDYLLTPLLRGQDGEIDSQNNTAYLWHLDAPMYQRVLEIPSVYAWWLSGLRAGDPVWSNSGIELIYGAWDTNGCVGIYSYIQSFGSKRIDQPYCDTLASVLYELYDFAWSLDDTKLSYWVVPIGQMYEYLATLYVLSPQNGQRYSILTGYIRPTGTFWHPSGQIIAYAGWNFVGDDTYEMIGVVDLETNLGSTYYIPNTAGQIRLLGWIR
jgi:hypothetical protein